MLRSIECIGLATRKKYGFFRLWLFPVDEHNSFHAHTRYAFHTTFFKVGLRKWNTKPFSCGTDKTMYETGVGAPHLPEGLQVLGWSWYGSYALSAGGDVNFHFGDYYTCSCNRIEGHGKVPVERNRAGFKPHNTRSQCKSLAKTLGVCKVEPCTKAYRSFELRWMFPKGSLCDNDE